VSVATDPPLPVITHLVIRTDGAARGNPGPASLGAVLIDASRSDALDPEARPDATISEALGHQTNNVAEWTGVVRALELARRLGAEKVDLFLDSKLIVEQLHGRWRVKDAKLVPLWADAKGMLGGFRRWSATHVPRAQNAAGGAPELTGAPLARRWRMERIWRRGIAPVSSATPHLRYGCRRCVFGGHCVGRTWTWQRTRSGRRSGSPLTT
jgi:ribonuclease HI